jgi:hypothetical protein
MIHKYKTVIIAAVFGSVLAFTGDASRSSIMGMVTGSDLSDIRNDMNQQINAMRSMMDTNLQTALRAIPGSEWTEVRYWMFQNCDTYPAGDEQKKCGLRKAEARAYLDNIRQATGSSPDTPYQVSVYAEGKGIDWASVKMDAFQTYFADVTGSPARAFIIQELHRTEFRPQALVEGAFLRRPITDTEVAAKIDAIGKRLFDELLVVKTPVSSGNFIGYSIPTLVLGASDQMPPLFAACNAKFANLKERAGCPSVAADQIRAKYTSELKAAVMAPYENVADTRTVGRLTKDWEGLSVAQHLVVLIRADDVNQIFNKGGSLKVQLHEKDHPEKPHPRSRLVELRRADFKDDLAIADDQRGYGKLLYAIMYMQDGPAIGLGVADELMKQREALKRLNEAVAPNGAR